ncbi:CbaC protein [Natronolimnobius sp. AArcel1]|uniref:CbaC protein n=1 Tax=Natronolimnobius sp. AArcel1 TaxID=1679093 RepID=UPI001F155C7D|nr:CbaC protein [Natronolimnobius sp. AArcel1]
MRISKGGLLVVLAFTVPFLVELRTVLAWFNIELTPLESVILGLLIVAAIIGWAVWPAAEETVNDTGRSGTDPDTELDETSNGS